MRLKIVKSRFLVSYVLYFTNKELQITMMEGIEGTSYAEEIRKVKSLENTPGKLFDCVHLRWCRCFLESCFVFLHNAFQSKQIGCIHSG